MKSVHFLPPVCCAALALGFVSALPAVEIAVDFGRVTGKLDHNVWSSSGLAQGAMTRARDQNMQLIGSVPYEGCRWMRPHDLLDLVKAAKLDSDRPDYDWTKLDYTLDGIVAAGLTPLFELMGKPSDFFTSFLDRAQVYAWKRLVTDLAIHLEGRYGRDAVRGWLFESWNEPDIDGGWTWKTPAEHHNYYDACSEGLKAADPALRFGGPGLSRRTMPYGDFFQAFLNHCDTGSNFFTGEKGVRLDFISIHYKNKPKAMVDVEVANLNDLIRDHPRFASLPIFNDEADSEVGWNHPYPYRATPWYAAFIARSLHEHVVRIMDGGSITGGHPIDFRLSNDDAFWGPWEFRSQLAQFGTDEQFAFIKKPSHTVRTALALLGDTRVAVSGADLGDRVGAMATTRGAGQVAILLYNYSDQTDASGTSRVQLKLDHLPFSSGKWVHYRIDADHGDTHRQWEAMGSPAKPSDDQIQALRARQELGLAEPIADITGSSLTRSFDLPVSGVSLIVISADSGSRSEPIKGLYAQTYPSLSGERDDVMIKWNGVSSPVKTYEILRAPAPGGPFARINSTDQIETGFVAQQPPGAGGYAKIRAIDYWGRVVGESDAIALPKRP